MSDFLDIDETPARDVVPFEQDTKFLEVWMKIDARKQAFLLTWQSCNFKDRAAAKKLGDTTQSYRRWITNDDAFQFCRKVMRDAAMKEALDRGRLVLQGNDIVDRALRKKPILYQGAPTGFYEQDLGVALRGTELLMHAGGHLKEDKLETSYAHGPALVIQVVNASDGTVQIAQVNNGIAVAPPVPSFLEIDDVES